MAYSNLPLIWMFSGRNNIFLWATGWDYSTFNVFHRNIARVATIEAIVHSAAYTVLYRQGECAEILLFHHGANFRVEGYYTEELKESWFYLGILVCSFIVWLFSIAKAYQKIQGYRFNECPPCILIRLATDEVL